MVVTGPTYTPLNKILRREHKKMGCRNNICTNTDSSGSLDTALVDILVSLSGSFESSAEERGNLRNIHFKDTMIFIYVYIFI